MLDMLDVYFYFTIFYIPVILFLVFVKRKIYQKHSFQQSKRTIMLVLSVLLLLAPILPYVGTEARTKMYGAALSNGIGDAIESIDTSYFLMSFKVLNINTNTARVFVICRRTQNQYAGNIVTLTKHSNVWSFAGKYDTVWSTSGSADGNIFPPYPKYE